MTPLVVCGPEPKNLKSALSLFGCHAPKMLALGYPPPPDPLSEVVIEWHTSWFGVPKVYERIHSHLGDVGFHVFVLSRNGSIAI